jgi:dipeptidyl aminopeptidase/acylaminoacyl peptidase
MGADKMRPTIIVAVIALAFLTQGLAPLEAKHLITSLDEHALQVVDVLALSRNGQQLIYTIENKGVWLIGTSKGSVPREILHQASPRVFPPTWSPNGKYVALGLNRSGKLQLWVYDLERKRLAQLTHFPAGLDPAWYIDTEQLSWSPDSTKLIFPSQVIVNGARTSLPGPSNSTSPAPLVLTTTTPLNWAIHGVFANAKEGYEAPLITKASQLFIVDTATKKTRQLTQDEAGYYSPDWSPDGKTIVCLSSEGHEVLKYPFYSNLYIIDAQTGVKRALTTGLRHRQHPRWSPDGVYASFEDGEEAVDNIEVLSVGNGQLLNVSDKVIDTGGWYGLNFVGWTNHNSVIVRHRQGAEIALGRLDIQGNYSPITNGGTIDPAAASQSGTVAWVKQDGSSTGVIQVLIQPGTTPHTLLDVDPQIKDWELGEQEVIRWKNNHGDEREGIFIKPVKYQPGVKYPLIVDGYPSLTDEFYAQLGAPHQIWAERGYAVFVPAPRAPHVWTIYSKIERPRVKGPKGWDLAVDDVLSGVDELIQRGFVDPQRMALYGYSNGGGVVNYLVTQTTRFKCAASGAAVYPDWFRPFFLELGAGGDGVPLLAGGFTPWDDPRAYIALSAVFHLDRVATPMLLAVGDEDTGFLPGMIEMYNGLRYLKKDVTLLRYPNQEHEFTPEAWNDLVERMTKFFDDHLKQ